MNFILFIYFMKFASIKYEKRYIEYNDKSNTFIQLRFVL